MGVLKIGKFARRLRLLLEQVSFIPSDLKYDLKSQKISQYRKSRILLVVHAYWYDEFNYILKKINSLNSKLDIIVTLPMGQDSDRIKSILGTSTRKHNLVIHECENYGRDFGPFVNALMMVDLTNYDLVIKIHTKRSQKVWFRALVNSLIGSDKHIRRLSKKVFINQIGVLVHPLFRYPGYLYSQNQLSAYGLHGLSDAQSVSKNEKWTFPAGSMFAIKSELLSELLQRWGNMNFESENSYSQFSLAHKIERKIGFDSNECGYKVIGTSFLDYFDIKSYFVKII